MIDNPLVKGWPATVSINGVAVPIRTGFRTGIQSLLVQDPSRDLPEEVIVEAIMRLYYGGEPHEAVMSDPLTAFEAVIEWRGVGFEQGVYTAALTPKKTSPANREAAWDWDHDAAILIADFQRVYGIDLTDPSTQIHWYRFMTLFNGLGVGDVALTVEAQESRRPVPPGADKYERKRLKALAQRYALPKRETMEDFLAGVGW